MIALLALIIRLVLLAIFTFGFVVLFEHGPKNYFEHAKTDAVVVKDWLEAKLGKGMTKPVVPAASTPEPTPGPSAIPSAPAPSATPGSTPNSTPVATPASTPMATPAATPMTTPVLVPPPMPSPTVAASATTDEPKGAPSDWQSLQNQPIDDEVAPGSSQ